QAADAGNLDRVGAAGFDLGLFGRLHQGAAFADVDRLAGDLPFRAFDGDGEFARQPVEAPPVADLGLPQEDRELLAELTDEIGGGLARLVDLVAFARGDFGGAADLAGADGDLLDELRGGGGTVRQVLGGRNLLLDRRRDRREHRPDVVDHRGDAGERCDRAL